MADLLGKLAAFFSEYSFNSIVNSYIFIIQYSSEELQSS